MKFIVAILSPSGTGKTLLREILEKKFNILCYDIDRAANPENAVVFLSPVMNMHFLKKIDAYYYFALMTKQEAKLIMERNSILYHEYLRRLRGKNNMNWEKQLKRFIDLTLYNDYFSIWSNKYLIAARINEIIIKEEDVSWS